MVLAALLRAPRMIIVVVVVVAVDEEKFWIRRRPWKNSERGAGVPVRPARHSFVSLGVASARCYVNTMPASLGLIRRPRSFVPAVIFGSLVTG